MSSRYGTLVRLNAQQQEWLRQRAFEQNISQQAIIEDALVALGMPRGSSARTGDVVTHLPLPEGIKDMKDAAGRLWSRRGRARWQCWAADGRHIESGLHDVSAAEMVKDYGPMTVAKLRGQ
jgi:hypothetical protein